jgi:hypothetical protein
MLSIAYLWSEGDFATTKIRIISARAATQTEIHYYEESLLNDSPIGDEKMPVEIDFRDGVRGLHHIPPGAKVFLPASIERGVWEYFAGKAQQKGIDLSELLTDVLKRDIEINEALK